MAAVWRVTSRGRRAETEAPGQAAALVQETLECVHILLPGWITVH